MGEQINFTPEEDELMELIEDSIGAGKTKEDIIYNLSDKYQDITTSRFDYLFSIAKCKVQFKDSSKLSFKERNKKTYKANKDKNDTKDQVLKMLKQGASIADIANELNITQPTVSYHKTRLIKQGLYKEPKKMKVQEKDIPKKDLVINTKETKPKEIPVTCPEEHIPDEEIQDKADENLMNEIDILLNAPNSDFKADKNLDKEVIIDNKIDRLEGKENGISKEFNTKEIVEVEKPKHKENSVNKIEEKYDMWEVCKQLIKDMDPIEAVLFHKAFSELWELSKNSTVDRLNNCCNDLIKLMHEINVKENGIYEK